ncbi:FAD-dependent monooxygenase [Actinopolymorpha singaporensis]|uniref:2-polyprenyl-6-methoxyphenol hydroxylase n=1 Tax=Actinopolymorpha singaporensis TaxID=117157 RepID=A0A1H1MFH3_9ACTN|nr:FAD-dependent monooxygenase [Actinopolymorpha singaporensis]SDR85352.1 2-polyprenyl-6-methoxyphenol hydroxylase [Actinopolymorpha singaporensis]
MSNRTVLVSGAGVAGPAAAYWLRRTGYSPTVVERAPAPRPGGQAVDLRGAGRTVITRMGLMEQARALGLDQRGLALVDKRGRITARMPADSFGGEGIVSEIEILRGDLAELLYDYTLPDTEYLFDDTITDLRQDGDGVLVTFERAEPRRFDLVVGADGLHSTVRALAFGPEERYVRPLGCYTAWFTAPQDFALDGWYLMHNAPGGLVASARPGRLPGEVKAGLSFRSQPLSYDRRDVRSQQDVIAARFARVGWEVPRLLAGMRTSTDFAFDSIGQVHLDHWSRGRVVLLGDAGYCPTPLTGLGTSVALVGAYVLAGELAAAGGDHVAAFARYEDRIRPYVRSAQELPPGGVSGYAPMSAPAIWARGLSMRWMTRWPMRPLIARQFAKAADIELPEYAFASVG